ncbi:MAG: polyprenyl diphosphate synthase [Actinomycetota bacterium]|nr:polyprenyl diphosphate synthase [Actinomycetota bacterium]MDA3013437.1 polyprenyl diphosphate synthase [Actinomycetota bacterium]
MASSRLIYSIYENRLQKRLLKEKLPKHIGLIHDGHRRYAKKEGLLSFEVSYKIGMNRFKDCLAWCDNVGIEYITSWLLSRENLSRPKSELDPYFEVLNQLFEELLIDDVVDNFKVEFIGSIDMLPIFLQETISKLKEVRSGGQKTLTIALGYGGRQEILDAIKGLIDENRNDANDFDTLLENVTDEQLRQHLYSPETPDIDLIIRTSGESRLSGFLLWQSAYSEVIFQDVYWPEFRKIDFLRCLREYAQRERRFGQ